MTSWTEASLLFGGTLLAWMLALYTATRGGVRRVPVLTVLTALSLVSYTFCQSVAAMAPAESWVLWFRLSWIGASLAPGLWLLLALALLTTEAPPPILRLAQRAFGITLGATTVCGVVFALASQATNTLQRWDLAVAAVSSTTGAVLRWVPPGPQFGIYAGYLLGCLVGAVLLLWMTGEGVRGSGRFLLLAHLLFLLAGAEITLGSGYFGVSALPGQLALLLGLAVLTWTMACYGALLAGEVLAHDLAAFLFNLIVVALLYGLPFLLLAPPSFLWRVTGMAIVLLATTTHVYAGRWSTTVDRLLHGQRAVELRGTLRTLSERMLRQPDTVTALSQVQDVLDDLLLEQEQALDAQQEREAATTPEGDHTTQEPTSAWRIHVESALRHVNDLPRLRRHPLLEMMPRASHTEGTSLERAAVLREELLEAVERLRPSGPRPSPTSNVGGWLHYLVLQEAYVLGYQNKRIIATWHISESSFHRARRRALDALAQDLQQRCAVPDATMHQLVA